MCANYLPSPRERIAADFGLDPRDYVFKPEVYPGNMAPMIRLAPQPGARPGLSSDSMEVVSAMFGLVPHWADTRLARQTYNSRSETTAIKPAFREAWKRRQFCVIPVLAIFEPSYETGAPVRWQISAQSGQSLGIAGIWDYKTDGPNGAPLLSFSMLTVNADDDPLMRRFHKPGDEKRSVVILPPARYEEWLHSSVEDAPEFLQLFPSGELQALAAPRAAKPAVALVRPRPRKKPPEQDSRESGSGDLFGADHGNEKPG
ncbi:MAG: SOS response-associated peptidase [Janthinobacterium lividum]